MAAGLRSLRRDRQRCRLSVTSSIEAAGRQLLVQLQEYASAASAPSGPASNSHADTNSINRFRFTIPRPLLNSFQEYFFLSVTSVVKNAQDTQFACPVEAFLACFGYNEDDTFKMPSEVTSHLAGWQYLLRCTALFEAVRLHNSGKAQSVLRWEPFASYFSLEVIAHHRVGTVPSRTTVRST